MPAPFETRLVGWNKNPERIERVLCVAGATPSPRAHIEWRPPVQPEIGTKQPIGPPS